MKIIYLFSRKTSKLVQSLRDFQISVKESIAKGSSFRRAFYAMRERVQISILNNLPFCTLLPLTVGWKTACSFCMPSHYSNFNCEKNSQTISYSPSFLGNYFLFIDDLMLTWSNSFFFFSFLNNHNGELILLYCQKYSDPKVSLSIFS